MMPSSRGGRGAMGETEQSGADADPIGQAVRIATLGACAMIANQVGGKATRDALFLTSYDVTSLPSMVILASVLSLGVVLGSARLMTRYGPARLVPGLFALSAGLHLAEWGLAYLEPRAAAVALYLHLAAIGAVVISGFWSVVNERFDPRTAKRHISRIAGGATFGGLIGGLIAERMAAVSPIELMLPVLAALHLVCGGLVRGLGRGVQSRARDDDAPNALALIGRKPYLRDLAVLAAVGTLSAGLLDYVLKSAATGTLSKGEDLLRFFAVFYTGVGLVTFVVQATVGRAMLEKLGLARTTASLPVGVAITSAAAIVWPGLAAAAFARAVEAVIRSSAFRSGYELFFTPVSPSEKRATKSIIDVGFNRIGDALGAGLVAVVLAVLPGHADLSLLLLAIASSGVVGWITWRLRRGYVRELEASLRSRAVELDMVPLDETTTRSTVLRTIGAIDIAEVKRHAAALGIDADAADRRTSGESAGSDALGGVPPPAYTAAEIGVPSLRPSSPVLDPVATRIVELRSGDAERVRRALGGGEPLSAVHVGHVVPLLAWDEVCEEALTALRPLAQKCVGQLLDTLLDPQEEFTIRRRLPRLLCHARGERVVVGLLAALDDKRFEVRYQSGRALALIRARDPELRVERPRVYQTVLREVKVDKRVWESQRLLDEVRFEGEDDVVFELLRDRGRRSLQHVFTLLSLVQAPEPLRIAFGGLQTSDVTLRGTALEYLESVLPDEVRRALWPFLEDDRRSQPSSERSREEILDALVRSNASIQMNLEALRRRSSEPGEG